jgi:1L-myo-inositol 1-phosphate cytidylyltransferase / CDP-L-myo-inositol myo-inositolphosphotransferase
MTTRAILLANPAKNGAYAPHATRVAGLNLLERALAMLQWAGIQDTTVVVSPHDEGPSRTSLAHSQVLDPNRMRIHFVTDDDADHRGGLGLQPALARLGEEALVLTANVVLDRGLLRELLATPVPTGGIVSLVDGKKHLGVFKACRTALFPVAERSFAKALAAVRATSVPLPVSGRFWTRIDSDAAIRRAEDDLWSSCRKPHDGVVARHLNRHISLFVSRRIAHLPIAPNHVSMVTFALGIVTALCVAQGTYGYFLLGALLFKVNSILDGVDGELARVRYQMSVVGEWLDTISDDASNMMFYIALAIGSYRMSGASLWVVLGVLTAVPSLLATAHQYHLLLRNGRGDLLAIKWLFERGNGKGDGAQSAFGWFLDKAKYVVKKDFFVALVLVMALVGQLPLLLFITATANFVLIGTIVAQELLVLRLARAGKAVERVIVDAPTAPVPHQGQKPKATTVPARATARN